ncbi:MAG TPA: DUF881 domain-containing protein, partial [Kribbella sp.]
MSDETPDKPAQPAAGTPATTPGGTPAGSPADAPQTPTPMPKPKPRTPNLALRRLRAGFKPSRGQAIVAVVLALVACVAVVQVR